jgi:hypothetical protein
MDDNTLLKRLRLMMDVAHTKPGSEEEEKALNNFQQEEPGLFEVFAALGKAQREAREKEETEEEEGEDKNE